MSIADDIQLLERLSSLSEVDFYKELPLVTSGYLLVFRLAGNQDHIPSRIKSALIFLSRVFLSLGIIGDFKSLGVFSLDVPFMEGSLVISCVGVLQGYLKENDINLVVSKSMHTGGVLDCFNVLLLALDNFSVSSVTENSIITLNFTATVALVDV